MSRALAIIVIVALVLLLLFAALNWSALAAPTSLSFLGAAVQAPLGLILVATAIAFALLSFLYAAVQRTTVLLELRRHTQALEAQRRLAEEAEASRLNELRAEMRSEFAELRRTLEESANGLAATIGELGDRLEKRG
jgi:uncharacterized integral membrane protein